MSANKVIHSRIDILRNNLQCFFDNPDSRIVFSENESKAYAKTAKEVYGNNTDLPEVKRKAEFLTRFAEEQPVMIDEAQLLVGSKRFGAKRHELHGQIPFHGNHGHIIAGYTLLLQKGVGGLIAELESLHKKNEADEADKTFINRQAFIKSLCAFSRFIERHSEEAKRQSDNCTDNAECCRELLEIAEVCRAIQTGVPQTFRQALQLVWFTQIFLYAEGLAAAFSFGRFDQYLWPFLQKDLQEKTISLGEAEELVSCFWFKTCECGESQNLTLGGLDRNGNCAENPLSMICLKITSELRLHQPSVSVRISEKSSAEFVTAACELCAAGFGMPSFFNDEVVTKSLLNYGYPAEYARDWGVVGCYEITSQENSASFTVAASINLAQTINDFFALDCDFDSFENLYTEFKKYFIQKFSEHIGSWQNRWDGIEKNYASPFESSTFPDCISSGLAVEESGARFTFMGINILGFGTLTDSLYVTKKLVFEEKKISYKELSGMVKNNFDREESLQKQLRNLKGRYGSDSEASNAIAQDLSLFIGELFHDARLPNGIRLSPGLFLFGHDMTNESIPATPDGRAFGEPCSYGAGPSSFGIPGVATAVLNSAACVRHEFFPNGNPLLLSLPNAEMSENEKAGIIKNLVENYFLAGGFHLHINMVDAEQLENAQKNPELNTSLQMRVSGFSAKFTAMQKRWQDTLIERAKNGF